MASMANSLFTTLESKLGRFGNLEASVRSRSLDGARRALWRDLIEAGLN
jgi:hypothetical protein